MEWQPIETAPVADLHYPSSEFRCLVVAYGRVGEAEFHGQPGETWAGWWWANLDSEYGGEIEPTHWMPLPQAPAAMAKEQS